MPCRPFFLAKVALVHCNMQMGKCDHQILLERKMTDFYVRGTSFHILFVDFLTLILHNLPEAAPCFSWYGSIGLVNCLVYYVYIVAGTFQDCTNHGSFVSLPESNCKKKYNYKNICQFNNLNILLF